VSDQGNTRQRRIVHVITRLELGGAQQNTLHCVAHHDRERFSTILVAGEGGELDSEARSLEDAEVHLVPYLRHPIAPVNDPTAIFRLASLFKKVGAELVHTHSSKAGVIGRLAARRAGVPAIVHTVHGWSFNATQPVALQRFYAAIERRLARFTDRLVVVSSLNREKGLSLGIGDPARYQVIHSGIDIADYGQPVNPREQVRAELGYGEEEFVVGAVACLKHQKAPLDFVKTAVIAIRREPRLRFFIAGDGPMRQSVEKAIQDAGLEEKIHLLGWRHDVVDLFHAMDVFLLTSLFEGLPRAVLQSMAAGTPVVATAVDGTPEVVLDGETGLLVPPGSPGEAAEAVLRVAADEEFAGALVFAASERLGEKFEIRSMVHELDDLYDRLLGQP
jgi:glycosyltransferase involved in cell wall biosynthesis